jgi:4-hydroxy-2-oxoheptanedioate aldolase
MQEINSRLPVNAFKQSIAAGEVNIGLWLASANGLVAEMLAGTGYEWLLIDGEHGPNDLRSILEQVQAISAACATLPPTIKPPHPVVRIPVGDVVLVKQIMELGVQTLLVPMIDTPEQAQEMARAMRYPPEGIRGMGSGVARSSRWTRFPNYVNEANDQACLIVQVESIEGVRNIDSIAATSGVDGVFIGPSDLSTSMGYRGQPGHPEVEKTIEFCMERIKAAGKAAGILATQEQKARQWMEKGASFVAVGVDMTLLAQSAKSLRKSFE